MRYFHGNWTHIFHEHGPDVMTRICYDTEEDKLAHMDIRKGMRWHQASKAEMADVEDSIKHANEEALMLPENYGLECSDSLPLWAIQDAADQVGA